MVVIIPKHKLDELAKELDPRQLAGECHSAQVRFRSAGAGAVVHRARNTMVVVNHVQYRLEQGVYQSTYFKEFRLEDPEKHERLIEAMYWTRQIPLPGTSLRGY